MKRPHIDSIISLALSEDIGSGDITTNALVKPSLKAKAVIISKENAVIAGQDVAKKIFQRVDSRLKYKIKVKDGQRAKKGDVISEIKGKAVSIITAERVALNFLQHLSGVATLTSKFVQRLKGKKTKLLDTRKTSPGLRMLEKKAVKLGGGRNHRLGLFDAYLIKENHITAAGGIAKAIQIVKRKNIKKLPIEVEVRTIKELRKALDERVDTIMLDNFTPPKARLAMKITDGKAKIEISGGIDLTTIEKYARLEPDYISTGKITNSAKAIDLSLIIQKIF